jgi:hypothetical protein
VSLIPDPVLVLVLVLVAVLVAEASRDLAEHVDNPD